MELTVTPESTDVGYQVFFKEALLELSREENRLPLISGLLKAFELSINDIRFPQADFSKNFLQFAKGYDFGWLFVSFGLEQLEARLQNPKDRKMVESLYAKLSETFSEADVFRQKITVRQQFSTEQDADSLLKTLNPICPSKFEELLHGRGVYYTLKVPKHQLTIYVTLVSSIFVEGGLYLSIENEFSPNQYKFRKAFEIVNGYYDFITEQLSLKIQEEY